MLQVEVYPLTAGMSGGGHYRATMKALDPTSKNLPNSIQYAPLATNLASLGGVDIQSTTPSTPTVSIGDFGAVNARPHWRPSRDSLHGAQGVSQYKPDQLVAPGGAGRATDKFRV
ncbi:hypothetical protein JG687_00018658 [Phytophthora cactorum]|uniref:Uncharacterized protein n=1 Tax=Phytophthora cactorum TaxID=29920 RepID=A0A8T1TKH0_9STRA|nr:hypothetical protein GQ600_22276 [Phytophthora cactorum]KAG6943103.1 hypothetical protein JG687_00018658 [Phytophthora cactorum]